MNKITITVLINSLKECGPESGNRIPSYLGYFQVPGGTRIEFSDHLVKNTQTGRIVFLGMFTHQLQPQTNAQSRSPESRDQLIELSLPQVIHGRTGFSHARENDPFCRQDLFG